MLRNRERGDALSLRTSDVHEEGSPVKEGWGRGPRVGVVCSPGQGGL